MSRSNGARQPFEPFSGFSNPNYTQVPDELFDVLMPQLSDIELRVLMYIVRRTFGFKKSADNISLKQIVEGIRGKDGMPLDRGAGVSKPSAVKAVKGLVEKSVITATRNRSVEKGDEPTTYSLRFQQDPGSTSLTRGGISDLHGGVNDVDPQETVLQKTDVSLSNIEGSHDHISEPENDDVAAPRRLAALYADEGSQHARSTQFSTLGEIIKQRERTRVHRVQSHETAAEPPPAKAAAPRRGSAAYGTTEEREKLYAYLRDFSLELGDEAQLSSSITQVLKIFRAAHIPMEHWDEHLYRARALTQEHSASITKRSGDPTRLSGKNKFPYFKKVIVSLVDPAGQSKRGSANLGGASGI